MPSTVSLEASLVPTDEAPQTPELVPEVLGPVRRAEDPPGVHLLSGALGGLHGAFPPRGRPVEAHDAHCAADFCRGAHGLCRSQHAVEVLIGNDIVTV